MTNADDNSVQFLFHVKFQVSIRNEPTALRSEGEPRTDVRSDGRPRRRRDVRERRMERRSLLAAVAAPRKSGASERAGVVGSRGRLALGGREGGREGGAEDRARLVGEGAREGTARRGHCCKRVKNKKVE